LKTINSLWKLWEALLLNISVMVTGDNPRTCCLAVQIISTLIQPLPFKGTVLNNAIIYKNKIRPYMTIYDDEHKKIQNNSITNVIIGVTNPLFLKVSL
jgi:hypothetical protein